MEFKKLSAVETVQSVSDTASVLIEEDGAIKRAPKNEVGGGAKKELVYEWNFSADDVITEIAENVNDDVTWMIDKNVNIGFEAEATFYGNELQKFTDENGESYSEPVINANIEAMLTISDSQYYMIRLKSDRDYLLYGYNESDSWMPSHQSQDRPYFDLYILNKKHIDADWNYIEVDNGGSFEMYASEYRPFKSVKIYKITR